MIRVKYYIGDKVRLLDGRTAKIIGKATNNNSYYYRVETYDGNGDKTYFDIFAMDMKLIKRKEYYPSGN